MSISVTVSGEDSTSVVLEQVLSDAVTVSESSSIQVTTTSGDAATVTISTGDPVTVTGNYSNYVTGDVVRPNEISDFLTSTQISSNINSAIDSLVDSAPDALNTLNELAAALNDDENFGSDTIVSISNLNSATGQLSTATGLLVQKSETGIFYTNDNPSGFITGVDLSDLEAATGNLDSRITSNDGDISALQTATGLLVQKSETGSFISESQTGQFYASSNPSGFITGVDLSYLETATGNLDSRITSNDGDISDLQTATGLLVQKSETGNFITDSDTGAFYAASNPSGFITGVDLSSYVQNSETGLFLVSGEDASISALQVGSTPAFAHTRTVKLHDDGIQFGARLALIGTTDNGFPGLEMVTDGNLAKRTLIRHEGEGSNDYGISFFTTNNGVVAEKVRFDGDGNVGIGTATPAAKLDVIGGILANTLGVGGAPDANIDLHVKSDSAKFLVENTQAGGEWVRFSAGTLGSAMKFSNAGTFGIGPVASKTDTAIVDSFYMSSDGDVGMGTTTPSTRLEVVGEITTAGLISSDDIKINDNTKGLSLMSTAGDRYGLKYGLAGVLGGSDHLMLTNREINGDILFGTSPGGGGDNEEERMRITSDGSVGIGTDTPSAKLHIAGAAQNSYIEPRVENTAAAGAAGFAFINSNQEWKMGVNIYDTFRIRDHGASTNPFVIEAGGAPDDSFHMDSNGNVGIGTASPDELLHLEATSQSLTREVLMKATVSDAGNDQFGIANGTSTNSNFAPSFYGYKDSNYGNGYIYSMNFRGLVPSSQDTTQTNRFGIVHFEAYTTSSATDPNNNLDGGVSNRKVLTVANGSDTLVNIEANGNVGIGTSTPTEKLEVSGDLMLQENGVIKNKNNNTQFRFGLNDLYLDSGHVRAGYSVGIRGNRGSTKGMEQGSTLNSDLGIYCGGNEAISIHSDGDTLVNNDLEVEGTTTVGKITLSENSFVTETGDFTLSDSHKGATILLQNSAPMTVTIPAQVSGHTTTFIAETSNSVVFATGAGISGFNSFNSANQIAGIYGQAQIIFKSPEYAFLGGNVV